MGHRGDQRNLFNLHGPMRTPTEVSAILSQRVARMARCPVPKSNSHHLLSPSERRVTVPTGAPRCRPRPYARAPHWGAPPAHHARAPHRAPCYPSCGTVPPTYQLQFGGRLPLRLLLHTQLPSSDSVFTVR
jgi:hypothetical protein